MSFGDRHVIRDHWDRCEHGLDERGPRGNLLPRAEQSTDAELCDGNRGDSDIVVIGDDLLEAIPGAVGVDEKGRVEQ